MINNCFSDPPFDPIYFQGPKLDGVIGTEFACIEAIIERDNKSLADCLVGTGQIIYDLYEGLSDIPECRCPDPCWHLDLDECARSMRLRELCHSYGEDMYVECSLCTLIHLENINVDEFLSRCHEIGCYGMHVGGVLGFAHCSTSELP